MRGNLTEQLHKVKRDTCKFADGNPWKANDLKSDAERASERIEDVNPWRYLLNRYSTCHPSPTPICDCRTSKGKRKRKYKSESDAWETATKQLRVAIKDFNKLESLLENPLLSGGRRKQKLQERKGCISRINRRLELRVYRCLPGNRIHLTSSKERKGKQESCATCNYCGKKTYSNRFAAKFDALKASYLDKSKRIYPVNMCSHPAGSCEITYYISYQDPFV